jgi:hypothetical protein
LFFLFSFFCPFPVGCGSEINECCIQSGNDLTVHHIFSSTKKRMRLPVAWGPKLIINQWIIIPVALSVRVQLRMPDRIVTLGLLQSLYKDMEVCTTVGNMGGFQLSDSHFLRRGSRVVDSFGENVQR